LVERVVWDHEVAGSNPVAPIFKADFMAKLFSLATMLGLVAALTTAQTATALAQAAVSNSTSPAPGMSPQTPPANPTEGTPALPSVEEMDQMFKQTPLGKAADEARLHAEWRDLSNKTVNDPDLIAIREHAEASSTDLEKRKRLRVYYATYFDRMRGKADSQELKDYIDARKMEQLTRLAQDRVRPGGTPSPTPGAKPAAAPPAKRKHKKQSPAPEPALPQ
jgi:hypothetical protein